MMVGVASNSPGVPGTAQEHDKGKRGERGNRGGGGKRTRRCSRDEHVFLLPAESTSKPARVQPLKEKERRREGSLFWVFWCSEMCP